MLRDNLVGSSAVGALNGRKTKILQYGQPDLALQTHE